MTMDDWKEFLDGNRNQAKCIYMLLFAAAYRDGAIPENIEMVQWDSIKFSDIV